jgi:hypothetical protein
LRFAVGHAEPTAGVVAGQSVALFAGIAQPHWRPHEAAVKERHRQQRLALMQSASTV